MHKPRQQHNIITKEAAKAIYHRVEASSVPLAIFAANGSWNATKVNTTNFARQMQKAPELFIALYDINSRLEWIEDDMYEAGIR